MTIYFVHSIERPYATKILMGDMTLPSICVCPMCLSQSAQLAG